MAFLENLFALTIKNLKVKFSCAFENPIALLISRMAVFTPSRWILHNPIHLTLCQGM